VILNTQNNFLVTSAYAYSNDLFGIHQSPFESATKQLHAKGIGANFVTRFQAVRYNDLRFTTSPDNQRRKIMTEPNLIDPRTLYHNDKFPQQEQDTPALQQKMQPKPDCGEESYRGHDRLLNRRVLITGGDSGIGRAVAIAFAREGADIALQFFPGEEADAQEVAALIEDAGRRVILLPFDLRDAAAPKEIISQTLTGLGGLDTLVLNAAQQISEVSLADTPLVQIHDTFKVNILSMFALVQAALPRLQPGSAILTTTSVQAFDPSAHLLDYAATKAAIANFTVGLAKQLAEKGIRVNGVAPGPIWTPLQLDHGQQPGALPEFGQESLLGRAGQPAELAPVYVFLASNEASYVTAQIYGVTGGEAINL
jgi:NAD(P)-dependent dehydrogenase (short-subunit alcohol dehydrogenase family)